MKLITPYGRSRTESRRVLRLKPLLSEERDVPQFARSDDRLVIAQWISAIDKIARKPASSDKKPTPEQRDLRERLGKACWALICERELLNGNLPEGIDAETLWRSKVHPYKDGVYAPNNGKQPSAKGLWYKRFASDVPPGEADGVAIAGRIYEHLYKAEYRLDPGRPNKRQGKIASRAESIEKNVLTPPAAGLEWGPADEKKYEEAGDVASGIYEAAKTSAEKTRPVRLSLAGEKLHAHYGTLFGAVGIAEAKQCSEQLFALHMAVKDCYARLLKKQKKDHGNERRKSKAILRILPQNKDALFALIQKQRRNRDLNHLIRLGKIIHYQAGTDQGEDTGDSTAAILAHWPTDVTGSRYWTSDGQAEIKRNEAFVRVWRRVLALMQRTATDWADPDGQQGTDILGSCAITAVTGNAFPESSFDGKLALLFGNRANLFDPGGPIDLAHKKAVLKTALEGLATLRHSAFHFKGLDSFAKGLEGLGSAECFVGKEIGNLWQQDAQDRAQRVRKTLEGADCAYFLKDHQAKKLLFALTDFTPATLPLPRFNRVVARAENTWKGKHSLSLPKSVSRLDMKESPAIRCRYICLKLLYERPFRHWIETADTKTLNGFIAKTVERGTRAAQNINAKNKSGEERALVASKASSLGALAEDEIIQAFFFRLSAATATDMRVQRGYESDAKQAQSQAKHIEDLKCELLALAFDNWLEREDYRFLLDLPENAVKPDQPVCALPNVEVNEEPGEHWQRHLYFLLHLAPVGAVSSLLHQMRKWDLLAGPEPTADKVRAAKVMRVLELWLDMHDAKFVGGVASISGAERLTPLYEQEEDFNSVFPPATGDADDDRRIPVRGLREILRFGHLKPLWPIFKAHRVTPQEVEAFNEGEGTSAEKQATREDLHGDWVRCNNKKHFPNSKKNSYREALQKVTAHRHRAARVLLTDHARLHDLMMAVLGRLVDYAGLFERDLYFVTLALIHKAGKKPEDVFDGKGIRKLETGQIIAALGRTSGDGAKDIKQDLGNYFGAVWDKENERRSFRNRFAHFNMLRSNESLDLTREVNDARTMMAYDRKLRNAVAKSVIELLGREGLDLEWMMNGEHRLYHAQIATRKAAHLGGTGKIKEELHGAGYVAMVAALFAGQAPPPEAARADARKRGKNGEKKRRAR